MSLSLALVILLHFNALIRSATSEASSHFILSSAWGYKRNGRLQATTVRWIGFGFPHIAPDPGARGQPPPARGMSTATSKDRPPRFPPSSAPGFVEICLENPERCAPMRSAPTRRNHAPSCARKGKARADGTCSLRAKASSAAMCKAAAQNGAAHRTSRTAPGRPAPQAGPTGSASFRRPDCRPQCAHCVVSSQIVSLVCSSGTRALASWRSPFFQAWYLRTRRDTSTFYFGFGVGDGGWIAYGAGTWTYG